MLRLICSVDVTTPGGMSQLEECVGELLGGEHHKCAFVRSEAFVRLRLRALYHRRGSRDVETASGMFSAFWEGLKVTLSPSGTAFVYVTEACVEDTPTPAAACGPLGRTTGVKRGLGQGVGAEEEEEDEGPRGVGGDDED